MFCNRIPVKNITDTDSNELVRRYEYNIPPCCSCKSLEQHESMGLCWGLLSRVENDRDIIGLCDECDMNECSPFFNN